MTQFPKGKEFFTIAEAATLCGVTRVTMWRWLKTKALPHTKAGGHHRISRSDLAQFMKTRKAMRRSGGVVDRYRILIVDDEPQVQRYLDRLLTASGYEVEVSSDGFEAGIQVMRFKPHLILLDLYMPDVDGFQACRLVKSDFEMFKTKILAFSGQATDAVIEKILQCGADAFVEKPIEKQHLLATVDRLLGEYQETIE